MCTHLLRRPLQAGEMNGSMTLPRNAVKCGALAAAQVGAGRCKETKEVGIWSVRYTTPCTIVDGRHVAVPLVKMVVHQWCTALWYGSLPGWLGRRQQNNAARSLPAIANTLNACIHHRKDWCYPKMPTHILMQQASFMRGGMMLTSARPMLNRAAASHSAARPPSSVTVAAAAAAPAAATAGAPPLPRVVLKGGKSRLFSSSQSPMVYGGAVDRVLGRPAPKSGDACLLCDGKEQEIAWGFFNPDSMYRVRIMQTVDEFAGSQPNVLALLEARIAAAVALRRTLGLPSAATTVYRLCNSEGDRLSGLVVDVLGDRLVVSSSAAWVERYKEEISQLLRQHAGVEALTWRVATDIMLSQEGWGGAETEEETTQAVEDEVEAEAGVEPGNDDVVVESGVRYYVDPLGQKTGFYADQREHRAYIRSLAAGAEVLDLCCYSGGFAISAALGGAASVLGVDSSAQVVALAQRNAELNDVQDRCSFERGDVAPWMSAAAKAGRQFDIVILDPPKLAPNRKALKGALRKYESLNAAAMRVVKPGGLLMTCSCSGAVRAAAGGEDSFDSMLRNAARRAGRRVSVTREGTAAPDHVVDLGYPEGRYLTNVLLRVA